MAVGLVLGVAVTGIAGAMPGTQGLNALTWVATVATVAALVSALGIYRVQHRDSEKGHQELLDRLNAQDQLLSEFASATPQEAEPAISGGDDGIDSVLTPEQRAEIEAAHGPDSIDSAWQIGSGRGDRPRLVRLKNGELVTVFSGGREGRTYVRTVDPRRAARGPRDGVRRGARSRADRTG